MTRTAPPIAWGGVRTVLFDMDGTLLDLYFDSYLWKVLLPVRYAERHGVDVDAARGFLVPRISSEEGTLNWYCLDYWTRELGVDIAALEREASHLIAVRPHAQDFLNVLKSHGMRLVLATNAHRRSLDLKLERTGIGGYFDAIVSAHDFGLPKEERRFWQTLQQHEPYDPEATLLIDDNPNVLRAARAHGIAGLYAVAWPDSRGPRRDHAEFPAIESFRDVIPPSL